MIYCDGTICEIVWKPVRPGVFSLQGTGEELLANTNTTMLLLEQEQAKENYIQQLLNERGIY